jgi:hypothetical protein
MSVVVVALWSDIGKMEREAMVGGDGRDGYWDACHFEE